MIDVSRHSSVKKNSPSLSLVLSLLLSHHNAIDPLQGGLGEGRWTGRNARTPTVIPVMGREESRSKR